MGLVFLALALLVLAMYLMVRFLRPPARPDPPQASPDAAYQERARVAAMAAALVLARQRGERPTDAWRLAGQADTMTAWSASHRTRTLSSQPN
jgi:Na+-transporting methylmalonyl-CoA/oxaloacetate decarboxylase gamma subunit